MKELVSLLVTFIVAVAAPAHGQTTAGVFGPNISEGDRSAQFRIATSPGQNNGPDRWEARIHYQHALKDNLRARIVLQGSDIETGKFESNFIQAELQWQFKKAAKKSSWQSTWASALRLDARLVEKDDGVNRMGVNWTNQWNPNQTWQFNNVVLVGTEIGSNARDGLILEIRNGAKYKIGANTRIGIESFSALGRSNALGNFNTQNHRLGPVMTGKIGGETKYLVGMLFGVSRPARDVDFRLWLTRGF